MLEQLTLIAEATGTALTPQRLQIYASDLADLGYEELRVAFTRARLELDFFPSVAQLRKLAGASRAESEDAEARKAWALVLDIANRYAQSDVHGNYSLTQGVRSTPPPMLSDRILATVRRLGGWRTLKCMTTQDLPFVQKRFYEEYLACPKTEQVDPTKLLRKLGGDLERQQLGTARESGRTLPEAEGKELHHARFVLADVLHGFNKTRNASTRSVAPRMTDAEWEARRETLKRQATELMAATSNQAENQ